MLYRFDVDVKPPDDKDTLITRHNSPIIAVR
jgi:hypothetical protein